MRFKLSLLLALLTSCSLLGSPALAQGFPPSAGPLGGGGLPSDGLTAVGGVGSSSDRNIYHLGVGQQVGDFKADFQYRSLNFHEEGWPSEFVQTNLGLSYSHVSDSGTLTIVGLGMAVSAERNSSTYEHIQPSGQLMRIRLPDEESDWGYMTGLILMPTSPFGSFPVPMLLAVYSPSDNLKLSIGFPMVSAQLGLWSGGSWHLAVAPFGIQRAAIQQTFSDTLFVALAYKMERNFFSEVGQWKEDELFTYENRSVGLEATVPLADKVSLNFEGGVLVQRDFLRVKSGINLNLSPIQEKSLVGGGFGQVSITVGL